MEQFSWQKFFSGLNTVVGWAKFASFWLKVAMICVPIIMSVWAYKVVYGRGWEAAKEKFYKVGYSDASDWFAKHPVIQTGDNATINNNVQPKNNHFQFGIYPLRIGWCE